MLIKLFLAGSLFLLLSLQAFAYDNASLHDVIRSAEINITRNPESSLERLALIDDDLNRADKIEINRIKALALSELGRFEDAMSHAETMCNLDNQESAQLSVNCALIKGRILDEAQNYLRAKDFYALALTQMPQITDPVLLNRFYLYASDLMRHMVFLNKSLTLTDAVISKGISTPYYAEAVLSKGRGYFRLKDWREAENVLTTYLALPNRSIAPAVEANMLGYLLVIYTKTFQIDKITDVSDRINRLLPSISSQKIMAELYLNKGIMLEVSTRLLEAETALVLALSAAKGANSFRLMFQITDNLERLYRKMGDTEKSRQQIYDLMFYYKPQLDVNRPFDIGILKDDVVKKKATNDGVALWFFTVVVLGSIFLSLFVGMSFGVRRARKGSIIEPANTGPSQDIIEMKDLKRQLRQEKEKHYEMEQLLIQQAKMASMGEMMAVVVHQWKQPLAAIQLISKSLSINLESKKPDVATGAVENKKLSDQADNMVAILTDFSRFFKPIDGDETFLPSEELRSAIEVVKHQIHREQTVIDTDISDALSGICVSGNANEFKQVIVNLITNAGDAVREFGDDGLIQIRMQRVDQNVCIDVADNGAGMTSEVMDKIFESWFTTKKDKGSGIGLYISKLIIETRLYGEMSVISDGEGRGSQFSIRIPISENKVL